MKGWIPLILARENTQPNTIAITVKTINQNIVPFGGVAMLPNMDTHDPHKLRISTMCVNSLPILPCGGHKQAYLIFSNIPGFGFDTWS